MMTQRDETILERSGRSIAALHRILPWVAALAIAFAAGQAWSAELDFHVRGSVGQFFVIAAPAQSSVALLNAKQIVVQRGVTDSLGGLVFRTVPPGDGYYVVVSSQGNTIESDRVTVLRDDEVPPQSFYQAQVLPVARPGEAAYGYLVARDGTLLSAQVVLPIGHGPFPTLVEYSGYSPSDPGPSIQPFRLFAFLLGYAYVGVNIRGTGCSGGAFDYFELLQSLDGYDAIETVAAQPWARGVGMSGVSYAGISQLFVARTRPPHLDGIGALSVIDDTFRGLYPGGIFNDGFAMSWARERQEQNRWPNPIGADWVIDRIERHGDIQCLANQLLREQNPDLLEKIKRNPYYPAEGNPDYPKGGDVLAPYAFVNQIAAPTFIAGAWQDDQTGGHWPVMLDQFSPRTYLRVVAYNGAHADSLGPWSLRELIEFLDFRIARRVPSIPIAVRLVAPLLYGQIFGALFLKLPADRFAGYSYEEARSLYDSEDPIRVYWESGARPRGITLGAPEPVAETTYRQWPPSETTVMRWYFQPGGRLADGPPQIADDDPNGTDVYLYDPSAKPRADFRCPGGEQDPNQCRDAIWKVDAVYDWRPLPSGKALAFASDPLPADLTVLGSGSVDLWIRSTAPDTDLEVTLTELRSDGQERYVQNGWLRASQRQLDEGRSTERLPRHTHLEADAALLPQGKFALARVELLPVAHVFRAGSRLRISVETPGGNRPLWMFRTLDLGKGVLNWIGHSVGHPSRLVLGVVGPAPVPTALPPCPTSLRSQPCRKSP
jgi:predicted acyl esterase